MALKSVKAIINNETYYLTRSGNEEYSLLFNAPEYASNYDVSIVITDDDGNETIISSRDEKYKDILTLHVEPSEFDLYERMFNMISPIYKNSKITMSLFNALASILSIDYDFIKSDFISQIFPQTATWGLDMWEDEYGIVTDKSKTYEERRTYLMSVLYNTNPMTPYHIKKTVSGLTNLPCTVIENIEPNTFLVTIEGYCRNIQAVRNELNKKTPAHLNYILRMAEIEELYSETSSGFAVSECEYYKLEVSN